MSATDTSAPALRPEYMERQKTRVRVLTPAAVIEGDFSHAPGVRLSDSLRNAGGGERYILLTDVTVCALDGSAAHESLAEAPFVLVSAAHASAIVPLGEQA